jgi:arylsulfatase A
VVVNNYGFQNKPRNEEMRNNPNVIFILVDDLGTLDANCYGAKHLHTPNIDRLAESGVRFTRAYSHTVCCPARANLLTGRHALRTGINNWTQNQAAAESGVNIHADEATAADIFGQNGYSTALFGKWHLGAGEGNRPLDMGFQEFFGHLGGFIENYTHHFLHGQGFHDLWNGDTEIFQKGKYFPRLVNDKALDFLERNQSNPFFLYLPYNLPHYPEQSEDRFSGEYENVDSRVRQYGMTVSTVDALIGEVIEKLESLGLTEDTIILFMSDNGHSRENCRIGANHSSGLPEGWYYGAHGAGYTGPYKGNKGEFTEGGIRIPCILSAPGLVPQNVTSDHVVCGLDWLPTVLSLSGIAHEPEKAFDGSDLSVALEADGSAPDERTLHFQWYDDWAVMQGDWKLIGSNAAPNRMLVNVCDENPEAADYLLPLWSNAEHLRRSQDLEMKHDRWMADVRSGYEDENDPERDRE